jgi:hypothetical protein
VVERGADVRRPRRRAVRRGGDARAPRLKPEVRWPRENWRILGGCAAVLAGRPHDGPGDDGVPSRRDADGPTR